MKVKPIRWVQTAKNLVNPEDFVRNYSGTVDGFPGIEFHVYPRIALGVGDVFGEKPIGGRVTGVEGFFDRLKLSQMFSIIEGTTIGHGHGYIAGDTVEEVQEFINEYFQQWVMNFFIPEPESESGVPASRYNIIRAKNDTP